MHFSNKKCKIRIELYNTGRLLNFVATTVLLGVTLLKSARSCCRTRPRYKQVDLVGQEIVVLSNGTTLKHRLLNNSNVGNTVCSDFRLQSVSNVNSCVPRCSGNPCVPTATQLCSCLGGLNYARTALYFSINFFLKIIYET